MTSRDPWWANAVCYQVYVRSFADSNGDGIGDLEGLRSRLGYLELLGVQALWLTPFYRSPMADHGYDVADPRDVDPVFGDLAAFDAVIADAHECGMKIIVDVVPNHSSDQHEWFQAALAAEPGSPERARYVFADGEGDEPPNNWPSIFGGPAWTQVPDGQWYLHLFAPEQPDLNWANPEISEDLAKTLRFWLDRGVDGFRIDVAHGMAKPDGLPSIPADELKQFSELLAAPEHDPRFDADGVHDIHRMIRSVVDEYPDKLALGEIWVRDADRFAMYLRPDELHQAFYFGLTEAVYDADEIREAITSGLQAAESVGSHSTWTLSNHDVVREVTRYGDGELGTRRARAMALVELALPGAVYIYNGEELGLPNVDLPDEVLQDPTWERSGHTERGRDGCRVPVPWEGNEPPFGFSTAEDTWLPMPPEWRELCVEKQLEDPGSMLSLYRSAIDLRQKNPAFTGNTVEWFAGPAGCFAFRRPGGLICALNTSGAPVPLPPGDLLLASGPLAEDGYLPTDTAAWLA
ncbi:DUF3459 domain-containing protein [Pseudonocardiaceae bacterium YIM PH 21723]|nr:DUF3459 domain-containing protein [Pseudonocardiaceae bacterium YIM PH 21723]